ncbi:MAG: DUF983 domain-containing protein [Gemmataceae bacterium]
MIKQKPSWLALLQQRCPKCREGRVFQNLLDLNKTCPTCGIVWEREPGYYVGSMYFSYFLAIAFLLVGVGIWYCVFPTWDFGRLALLSIVTFLPLVPVVYRYSKIVWMYFDYWVWPDHRKLETPDDATASNETR